MNDFIVENPMQFYRTSLRRKKIHQGLITSVETHEPFGKSMQVAIIELEGGLKGMIHADQFDTHKYNSLVGFIDHKVDFMVLDVTRQNLNPKEYKVFDEKEGMVLLSRVQALEDLEEDFWETADVDHVCPAVVSGFEHERLYVRVKGVTCILPVQDYEYDWTPSARNILPLGAEITVKIKKMNRDKKFVQVTRKELLEDPWKRAHENFKIKDHYRGVITGVLPNTGIFVKLAPGIEALVWFPDRLPSHGSLIGKTVAVQIRAVIPEKKRIRCKIVNFPHELL
ncbi:30S ribosomal protein S1 [Paenibacillus vini]|uniref:30S ribosomal protein S1 n=1 Tax=Paenibacillus vini TaxID=1476024 RepID=UPI0025B6E37F|nr:30S ribosomal protein S1 [Paenibacillus vini]MDN4067564.1 30S ribosomal protein S1 [Paenibacillus vini]